MTKICAKCKVEKPFEEFIKHKNKPNGIGPYCRPCARIITKDYTDRNRESILAARRLRRKAPEVKKKEREYARSRYEKIVSSNPNHFNDHQKKWIENNLEKAMCNWVKQRAKARGIRFDLTYLDIHIPDNCPILGIPIFRAGKGFGPTDNSPSLDRIDSTKGYIKGNVQVISSKANTMKSNATLNEMILLGKWAQEQVSIGGTIA
jgi:hypothetical protein